MRVRINTKTVEPQISSKRVSEQAMSHSLKNPEIIKYAKNLQKLQTVYKELLKKQAIE